MAVKSTMLILTVVEPKAEESIFFSETTLKTIRQADNISKFIKQTKYWNPSIPHVEIFQVHNISKTVKQTKFFWNFWKPRTVKLFFPPAWLFSKWPSLSLKPPFLKFSWLSNFQIFPLDDIFSRGPRGLWGFSCNANS